MATITKVDMKMEEKTYTGASLEQALKNDALTPSGMILVGMVKSSQKGGFVSFTRSGCDAWVDLPTNMIEQAEHVGQHACKDHSHPIMKITLKEAKDPEAKIFAALLAESIPTNSRLGADQGCMAQPPYDIQSSPYSRIPTHDEPQMDQNGQSTFAIGEDFGLGDFGGFGNRLGVTRCYRTTCSRCIARRWVCNGAGRCWWHCDAYHRYPCTKCFEWPW